jgi:N-acetyl-gamma-glutamyl-phosphate reductase
VKELNKDSMLRVAVIGATGYTGAELARLLAAHPRASLTIATASGERAGVPLSTLFPSLRGVCNVVCEELDIERIGNECDFAFIALPHGKALDLVPQLLERGVRVCDLGADFRLRDTAIYEQWYKLPHTAPEALRTAVYGLPEWNRERIEGAEFVANPGCYPTSAILALSPFVAAGAIADGTIIVDAASGSSGGGRSSFGVGFHHPEVSDDFKTYNVAAHRHTPEIEQALMDAAAPGAAPIFVTFTAHLLPIARGILSTCYAGLQLEMTTAEAHALLQDKYAAEPFVRVLPDGELPQIKHVAGSNFCDIGARVDTRTNRLIVVAAEDNLLKGASGQAIQNMNLMCCFEETAGLLSAPVFP